MARQATKILTKNISIFFKFKFDLKSLNKIEIIIKVFIVIKKNIIQKIIISK